MSISPTCLGKEGGNCSRGNGKAYQGGMFETKGFISLLYSVAREKRNDRATCGFRIKKWQGIA